MAVVAIVRKQHFRQLPLAADPFAIRNGRGTPKASGPPRRADATIVFATGPRHASATIARKGTRNDTSITPSYKATHSATTAPKPAPVAGRGSASIRIPA